MHLLNARSKQLEILHSHHPPYAIVSHRWGDESEEVLFTDIGDQERTQSKGKGYEKIVGSCAQAIKDGLNYVWLDTCCIDKRNSTELGEAINSMYKWYRKSNVCYAYLHDVTDASKFTESDWFTRGWTLQELIAPKHLKFFTKDWILIGTKEDLIDPIAERTGISREILRTGKIPREVSVSQRMSWAARRETSKVEDRAYSMLGILDVNMVTNYGIEHGAFEELQHRIISRYDDQTLFSWYHHLIPPDDVEMADADLVPNPVPESTSESVDCDASVPSPNTTGLLAPSPSQYLKSYEISEDDFRKNYVDGIREQSYRSNFSISNNLVRISVPVKHMEGRIWKAVLRCSFEPPGGDEPQRPLIIFLEETQPWKYYRVHIPRSEEGDGDDDQTDEAKGVPGSLERLSDAESHLEGPVADDPDTLPEPTEAERIAQLPQHPPGVKTTNIVICGEPGVAAGRVINLIIGKTIIKPLTDYDREAMAVTPIDTTLQSKNIRIFYIIGPRDPYLDLEAYYIAVRNMYELVQRVKESGGIHLMLLCMVGSRVTAAVETNYRLFNDFICQKQVPMMLIITGLGKTKRMEDWWDRHKSDRELQAMRIVNHACITVLQGEDEEHERKYQESAQLVRRLLVEFMDELETSPKVHCPEEVNRWFVSMGKQAMDLLLRGLKKSIKQEAVAKTLKEAKVLREPVKTQKEGVYLTETDASDLAEQFFDEHAMEL